MSTGRQGNITNECVNHVVALCALGYTASYNVEQAWSPTYDLPQQASPDRRREHAGGHHAW